MYESTSELDIVIVNDNDDVPKFMGIYISGPSRTMGTYTSGPSQ